MEAIKNQSTIQQFIQKVKSDERLKKILLRVLIPKNQARPRRWVKIFINPFKHQKGRNTLIRRNARMDLLPFRSFSIGKDSTIEDFSVVNNGMGAVKIGDNVRIGLSNVLIGPLTIGNYVILAQNVVISGLNHGFREIETPICKQKCTTSPIVIEDECWIGANAVITAGVTIGKHSVVAAGSVVTKDIASYSIAAGNPARVIKKYNPDTKEWEKVKQDTLLQRVS